MMRHLLVAVGAAIPFALGVTHVSSAQAADAVCFSTTQYGISCVTSDGIKNFAAGKELPVRYVSQMIPCGDKAAIAGNNQIVLFDGEKFEAPIRVTGGASRVACDGKGGIWASGYRGISYWDGSGWKTWERADVAKGEKNPYVGYVAAGPEGTAWAIISGRAIAHYDGKAWKVFSEGNGLDQRYYMSEIEVVNGVPMVPHSRGVLTYKDGKWTNVPGPRGNRLHVGRNGTIWINGSRNVTEYKDGKFRELKQPPHSVYDVTSDGEGRVWVATNFGVGVLEGDKWQFRQMHNSPVLSNQLRNVVAFGKGAALPAESEQKDGSLRGRLEWQSGDPAANMEIEICGIGSFFLMRGKSPCDGQPLAHSGKSDGDGKFEFKTVKPAAYLFYFKGKGGRWYGMLGFSSKTRVEPGQAKNTGTIKLSDRAKPE